MMNLSSLLNSNEEGSGNQPRKTSPPPRQPQRPQQPPSTPVQAGVPQPFRDYSNTVHASPSRSLSVNEYGAPQHTPNATYSPSAMSGGAIPYGARPVPPQLQPVAGNDIRSPGTASVGGPSPYRHTPNGSVSGSVGGYPFPPTQAPAGSSPVLHHQHTPSNAYPPSRDGYSQPPGPQSGVTGPPPPYLPGQQPLPQGSPITAPNNAIPYLHQRSQSTHSTPTPTSTQSQQSMHPSPHPPPQQPSQYGVSYSQGSPIVAHRPPPQQQQQQQQQPPQSQPYQQQPPFDPGRLPSQPPTPLGPPLPGAQQRTASISGHYPHQPQPQPASPLQHRVGSTPVPYPYQAPAPHTQPDLRSPPLPTSSIPPAHSRDQKSDSQQPVDRHRRSLSQSDRARSISVSPKTRVSSLQSVTGAQPAGVRLDSEQAQQRQQYSQPPPLPVQSTETPMEVDSKHNGTSIKRKMDDRDLNSDELERNDARRPPPFQDTNGTAAQASQPPAAKSTTPAASLPRTTPIPESITKAKTRKIYKEPPVWAQRYDGGPLNLPNLIVRKTGAAQPNGKPETAAGANSLASRHTSRQTSPEALRVPSVPQAAPAAAATAAATAAAQVSANEARIALLGPWEESITGEKPYEELTRKVADFLYINVVSNPNTAEIQSLGVQFEIEAKLGTLISKDTNQRVSLPVVSECILQDTGRTTFKSSMTEVQHKSYNEFLNGLVFATDARNPANAGRLKPRVPIVYKHRREVDKFYELPMQLQDRLPACVRNLIPHRHTVKVRVTYDKKTNEVLAKIVKARISDLNIYFPDSPLDCRLSVNLEMTWEGTVEEIEKIAASSNRERQPDREKDRLSYNQSHYQVDLTQVTYKIQGPNKMEREEKEHELEIELSPNITIDHGRRAANGESHAYQELVDGFVDNIRILARRAKQYEQA